MQPVRKYHGSEMGAEIMGVMKVLLDIAGFSRMTPFLVDICLSCVLYNKFCTLKCSKSRSSTPVRLFSTLSEECLIYDLWERRGTFALVKKVKEPVVFRINPRIIPYPVSVPPPHCFFI